MRGCMSKCIICGNEIHPIDFSGYMMTMCCATIESDQGALFDYAGEGYDEPVHVDPKLKSRRNEAGDIIISPDWNVES